ncbi:hypothetical protein HK101_006629 [Irineochytrium annulatum]|nr:hypothetical protein HK101_006629 [Irineochytrium annulatum]
MSDDEDRDATIRAGSAPPTSPSSASTTRWPDPAVGGGAHSSSSSFVISKVVAADDDEDAAAGDPEPDPEHPPRLDGNQSVLHPPTSHPLIHPATAATSLPDHDPASGPSEQPRTTEPEPSSSSDRDAGTSANLPAVIPKAATAMNGAYNSAAGLLAWAAGPFTSRSRSTSVASSSSLSSSADASSNSSPPADDGGGGGAAAPPSGSNGGGGGDGKKLDKAPLAPALGSNATPAADDSHTDVNIGLGPDIAAAIQSSDPNAPHPPPTSSQQPQQQPHPHPQPNSHPQTAPSWSESLKKRFNTLPSLPPLGRIGVAGVNPNHPHANQPRRQNMVLPSYEAELGKDNTVSRETGPKRAFQRVVHYVGHFLFPWAQKPAGRVERLIGRLIRTPYDVKEVAVIGVHGWFPGRLIQRVVGEPTGTSARFAEKMAEACRRFFLRRYGITLRADAVTLMPLEGEGKVEERVDLLYRQLVDPKRGWLPKLRSADLILVAAHSQGTPVSVMLWARLVKEGIVDLGRQRAAILAMAGISHGPFPPIRSNLIVKYFEADAARELFEFNDWGSGIAKRYQEAMQVVLGSGTKVVAVGSWYDQVVPFQLYSATMHGFEHPSIYRAIYIEGSDYTPDFLSHLVVYALRLRNGGISDRGLIVYLSELLEGNLYGFGTQGHSTLYEEINTYTLAVAWAMGNYVPPPLLFTEPDPYFSSSNPLADSSTAKTARSATKPAPTSDAKSASLSTAAKDPRTTPSRLAKDAKNPSPPPPLPILNPMGLLGSHLSPTKRFQAPSRLNPYHLPWIMARIYDDKNVQSSDALRSHLEDLIRMLDRWEPSARGLRDLQFRLDPLRARL